MVSEYNHTIIQSSSCEKTYPSSSYIKKHMSTRSSTWTIALWLVGEVIAMYHRNSLHIKDCLYLVTNPTNITITNSLNHQAIIKLHILECNLSILICIHCSKHEINTAHIVVLDCHFFCKFMKVWSGCDTSREHLVPKTSLFSDFILRYWSLVSSVSTQFLGQNERSEWSRWHDNTKRSQSSEHTEFWGFESQVFILMIAHCVPTLCMMIKLIFVSWRFPSTMMDRCTSKIVGQLMDYFPARYTWNWAHCIVVSLWKMK